MGNTRGNEKKRRRKRTSNPRTHARVAVVAVFERGKRDDTRCRGSFSFFSFAKARSRERDYATRLKRMQRNNGSVVCLSALRLEKKRKRGCKAARARGRATRGGGKRERERVPRTFFHATGTNERAKSPRQRSFDDVCFFPKARMISDAFFLVVVRCFKKATYFSSHFRDTSCHMNFISESACSRLPK